MRRLIEVENCALSAQAASEVDLDRRIAETIGMMEKEFQATSKGFEADRLFHIRIAEATANGALAQGVHNLGELRRGPMYGTASLRTISRRWKGMPKQSSSTAVSERAAQGDLKPHVPRCMPTWTRSSMRLHWHLTTASRKHRQMYGLAAFGMNTLLLQALVAGELELSGAMLMETGLPLPSMPPEAVLLIAIEAK